MDLSIRQRFLWKRLQPKSIEEPVWNSGPHKGDDNNRPTDQGRDLLRPRTLLQFESSSDLDLLDLPRTRITIGLTAP